MIKDDRIWMTFITSWAYSKCVCPIYFNLYLINITHYKTIEIKFIKQLIKMCIDVYILLTLWCCSFHQLAIYHLVIVYFRWLNPELRTFCRRLSDKPRWSTFSAANLKLLSLHAHFLQSFNFNKLCFSYVFVVMSVLINVMCSSNILLECDAVQ